eukprot:5686018-Heterocapsa_arctica.AAC.1
MKGRHQNQGVKPRSASSSYTKHHVSNGFEGDPSSWRQASRRLSPARPSSCSSTKYDSLGSER